MRVVAAVATAALHLSTAASGQQAAAPPRPTASSGKAPLDTVTVAAPRDRKEVEREVNEFVFAVVVRSLHDSLSRWNTPISPLVAGLPREQGEFVLARLSQVATEAKAPLAGERCTANFFIVVTPQPELLLKKWQARDRRMFDTRNGMGHVRRFLDTPRAVRVWYNVGFTAADGQPITSDSLASALVGTGLGLGLLMANVPTVQVSIGTRLRYSAVRSLSSVIVVVDANRMQGLNVGQLADYIGMVGLAEVNQDAQVGPVPTILRLFRDNPDPPQALSAWDQAFLASLYGAEQASVLEESRMKRSMVSTLAPSPEVKPPAH